MSITDVLDEYGVQLGTSTSGEGWTWIRCPFHEHNNGWEPMPHPKPRASARVNFRDNLFQCFSAKCAVGPDEGTDRRGGRMLGARELRAKLSAAATGTPIDPPTRTVSIMFGANRPTGAATTVRPAVSTTVRRKPRRPT
jgi:hypothetical protein